MTRTQRRALARFERSLTRTHAPETRTLAVRDARRFLAAAGKPPSRITPADVREHLALLADLGLASATRARALSSLRLFCRCLVDERTLADDPTAGLRVKVDTPPQLLLSREAVQKLLLACHAVPARFRATALRDRALLELLYGLGLRSCEARAARVVDLDLSQGTLLVRHAKGGEPAVLPLPRASLPHLRRYLLEGRPRLVRDRDPGHLLVTRKGKPLHANAPGTIVRTAAARARVARCHPHALRRALATHLVEAGASLRVVQLVLGHASLEATALYVGVSRSELRRAVAVLELGGYSG